MALVYTPVACCHDGGHLANPLGSCSVEAYLGEYAKMMSLCCNVRRQLLVLDAFCHVVHHQTIFGPKLHPTNQPKIRRHHNVVCLLCSRQRPLVAKDIDGIRRAVMKFDRPVNLFVGISAMQLNCVKPSSKLGSLKQIPFTKSNMSKPPPRVGV